MTISELAVLGKPSVLIPYPFSANQHQEINARTLADVGAAEILMQDDLSGGRLAEVLMKYMDDQTTLKNMSKQALKMGRPHATKAIVDELEEMVSLS